MSVAVDTEFGRRGRRRLPLWRKLAAGVTGLVTVVGFYVLSAGTVVLNGTASLPHTGYLMVHWPVWPVRGSYVAFPAPESVTEEVSAFSFVKRVAGVEGDLIEVEGARVCVEGTCRSLLPELVERGIGPIDAGAIPPGHVFVVGDAENSLDSRYGAIGLVAIADIEAVGVAAPLPHWREVRAWFAGTEE